MTAASVLDGLPAVTLIRVGGGTRFPMETASCWCGEPIWRPDPQRVFPGRPRRWLHTDGRQACRSRLTLEPTGGHASPRLPVGGVR